MILSYENEQLAAIVPVRRARSPPKDEEADPQDASRSRYVTIRHDPVKCPTRVDGRASSTPFLRETQGGLQLDRLDR